jgi:hypothetical protein
VTGMAIDHCIRPAHDDAFRGALVAGQVSWDCEQGNPLQTEDPIPSVAKCNVVENYQTTI